MALIVPDPISLTTHHLHLCFTPTDAVLSSGTGFIYKRRDSHFLITAWHNVSGRSPLTGACLSETLAVPDAVSTLFRSHTKPGVSHREMISLYRDTEMTLPSWYEHPQHGSAVDVVAVPLPADLSTKYRLFPINDLDFDHDRREEVADDAFVVGYPFSETPYLQLPIWKQASIASEPSVNIDQLPKMLIDTATRPGLSGSPTIMQRTGLHPGKDGIASDDTIIGRIRNFIGVYSGRVGTGEVNAQLGVVWKVVVLDEIIDAGFERLSHN